MAARTRGRLLIVDDEVELKDALCETLADEGFTTAGAANGPAALEALQHDSFDLLLTDLMMPDMDGIELLRKALEVDPNLVGLVMTGQGTIPSAVAAMKVGAFDYLLKPFSLQMILPPLERALAVRQMRAENTRLRQYVEKLTFESPRYQIVGSSPAVRRVIELIEKVAPSDSTVLVCGASGTGKELVARALHGNSRRRTQPLVTVNCATLQESLLESELFGHEKGAFTGAVQAKVGLIELAEGGTLFIDEVAEMMPALQAKLLRVLENGQYRRVGSTKECWANVRVVAATNKPLEQEQQAGRFREDLFYRLNVVKIDLPPLRQRREDIPALVEHLLRTRPVQRDFSKVDPAAMIALQSYSWPGNIRELANVLERAQLLSESNCITLDDLPETLQLPGGVSSEREAGPFNLAELEKHTVQAALTQAQGNKVQAARALGVSRRALYRLIEKYCLGPSAGCTT